MNVFGYDDRPIELAVSGLSDPGLNRRENQDHFLVADLSLPPHRGGLLLDRDSGPRTDTGRGRFDLGPKGALVLVADGMGGAAAGALASRLAAAWIHEELCARWGADRDNTPQRFTARLREAVEAANTRIHEASLRDPDSRGMGTTATAAGVLDNFLYLAQVGDSRAYLVRDGKASQLTRDQSLVQELLDAGALAEEAAGRSNHRNVILQALGAEPDVHVELTYQEVRRGDALLLCSDGLHGVVRRDEIARAFTAPIEPERVCGALVELANARGGPDNVTAVVVRLDGAGLEEPMAGDVVGRQIVAWR